MKINHEPLPLLDHVKVLTILSEISLLGGFSDAQLNTIFSTLRTLNFKKNHIIFKQDDQPCYIYIVLSGQIKIIRDYKSITLELLTLESGQCFGETSLIGIQAHSSTAIAMQNCELLTLSRDALISLFEQDKELYSILVLNIARETSRHLRDSREHFIEYAMTHQIKNIT
jgi:CRP/FNR family transcriptional regulator, cyclic AMP receptor protein